MPRFVPTFSGLTGALFDYLSGSDQTQGLVPVTKLAYGADGSAVTRVGPGAGLPTAPQAPVPDTAVAGANLDPTNTASLFSVTPNGNGTVVLKIGTPGVAFPGGAVVVFEKVRVPGATPAAVKVLPGATPTYTPNSGRVKSTTVGGEFTFPAEAAVSVQARIGTAGTTGAIPVTAQLGAPPAVQPVVPINVGQTTRLWNEAGSLYYATGSADAASAAMISEEVEVYAIGAALWYCRNQAAVVGSGAVRIAADERKPIQCVPGDIIHFIQDVAAGHILLTPVA